MYNRLPEVDTILVVEDNKNNCSLIRDILTFHGCEIAVAADGLEGVALARKLMPDLVKQWLDGN